MTKGKEEASPIAKLLGFNGIEIIGWVYVWNTSELSILWKGNDRKVMQIEFTASEVSLEDALSVSAEEVTDLIRALLTQVRENDE